MNKPQKLRAHGHTLMEVMIGSAVLVIAMTSIGMLFQSNLFRVRQVDRAALAEETLLIRADQVRGAGWVSVSSPAFAAEVLSTTAVPDSDGSWPLTKEIIAVYPCTITGTAGVGTFTSGTTPLFTVTKTGTGAPAINNSGTSAAYVDYGALKFDISAQWTDGNRTHSRRVTPIVARTSTK